MSLKSHTRPKTSTGSLEFSKTWRRRAQQMERVKRSTSDCFSLKYLAFSKVFLKRITHRSYFVTRKQVIDGLQTFEYLIVLCDLRLLQPKHASCWMNDSIKIALRSVLLSLNKIRGGPGAVLLFLTWVWHNAKYGAPKRKKRWIVGFERACHRIGQRLSPRTEALEVYKTRGKHKSFWINLLTGIAQSAFEPASCVGLFTPPLWKWQCQFYYESTTHFCLLIAATRRRDCPWNLNITKHVDLDSKLTMFGAGAWVCRFTRATSLPDCASAINFNETKKPSLSRKPFPFGSDNSQICQQETHSLQTRIYASRTLNALCGCRRQNRLHKACFPHLWKNCVVETWFLEKICGIQGPDWTTSPGVCLSEKLLERGQVWTCHLKHKIYLSECTRDMMKTRMTVALQTSNQNVATVSQTGPQPDNVSSSNKCSNNTLKLIISRLSRSSRLVAFVHRNCRNRPKWQSAKSFGWWWWVTWMLSGTWTDQRKRLIIICGLFKYTSLCNGGSGERTVKSAKLLCFQATFCPVYSYEVQSDHDGNLHVLHWQGI